MTTTATYNLTKSVWIDEYPEHWKVVPVWALFDDNKVKNQDLVETNVLSLSYGNLIKRDVDSNMGLLPESFDTYQIVKKGNIILRLTDLQNDKKSLRVGLAKEDGIITSAYTGLVLKFDNCLPDYLYYHLHSLDIKKYFYSLGGGVRQSIGFRELKWLKLPIPPIAEQDKIVAYINTQTQKITHFIAKKQRFIELLKEQRQSIINEAVTKGIDKKVKLKDTGIEWLGNVPEHWDVRRLASIGTFSKGGNISRAELIEDENGLSAILYGDIYTKYDIVAEKIINRISEETALNSVEIKKGDLLFTGSGETKEDIGKCIVYNGDETVYAGGDVIIFKQEIFDSVFISYSQNSSYTQMQKLITAKGDIIVHTYSSKLKNVLMPYPPLKEQQLIVAHIKTETATIDTAIAKTLKEIELIKEYKQAMISEAVMGKINFNKQANN